jgi:anti-sigma-K factor RskA
VNEHRDPQSHEAYEEMAAALVLGALAEPDRTALATHVRGGCALCAQRFPELSAGADALLLAVEPVTPPAALRSRILRAAGVSESAAAAAPVSTPAPVIELRPARRETFYRRLALAACLALALVSWRALVWHRDLEEARRRTAEVEAAKAELAAEVAQLRTSGEEQAALINLLRQPGSGLVTLASLAPAPNASGRVLWDPKAGRGYLWVNALPPDPTDKDYQLWAIIAGTPVSAGVFSVGADGTAVIPLLDIGREPQVATFAITLEPAGGMPQPTGQMVLMGSTGV